MIVCTSTVDTLCRQAFGSNNVAASSIKNMIEQFPLDPALQKTPKEIYIVSDKDVRNRKLKTQFLEAAANKHPDVRIAYLSSKADISQGNGIDLVMVKATPDMLAQMVSEITQSISAKAPIVSSGDTVPQHIDFANLNKGAVELEPEPEVEEPVEEPAQEEVLPEIHIEIPEPEPEHEEDLPAPRSELIERIEACNAYRDVTVVAREFEASKIVKDIVKNNQQYVLVEEQLKVLQEKINSIFMDPRNGSTSQKFDKVKALLYDKNSFKSVNNSIVSQRVIELISTLVDKTKETLDKRTAELDKMILAVATAPSAKIESTRLSALISQRADLLAELSIMDKELAEIGVRLIDTAQDISSNMIESQSEITENPLVNAKLRINGQSIIPDNAVEQAIMIMETADRASEEFKEARRNLLVLKAKLNKVLEYDQETMLAFNQYVNYLRASSVEDLVVTNDMLKLSMRIFVAKRGAGSTVVPYTISALQSRTSANVLYLDLTGYNRLSDYGENDVNTVQDWIEAKFKKQFCKVVGTISESPESIQRLEVALTHAAEHYRIINVVVSPEQVDMLMTLAPSATIINYVTDPYSESIDFYKNFVKETTVENTAQRIIINRCDVPTAVFVDRLDLMDNDKVDVKVVPYLPDVIECGLHGVKPHELESIQEGFKEVLGKC